MIRVVVVGNVALFRSALAATLANEHDLDVVGECGTGRDAGTRVADVAVLDPDPAGPPVTPVAGLTDQVPGRSVVLLTSESPQQAMRYAACARVRAVVAKAGGIEHLLRAVRRAAAGERVIEPAHAAPTRAAAASPLTRREVEVLRLAAEGQPSKRIADTLGLTAGTVRNYMSTIIRKAGARNRLEAIRTADEAGWLYGEG